MRERTAKETQRAARELYKRGLSVRKVAAEIGVSKSAVWEWVAAIGRNKEQAWAISEHRSFSKRACRKRSRAKIARTLGRALTPYEHVHHIDCDYTNTAIENLELLTVTEHVERHREIRRQVGQRWMPVNDKAMPF